MSGFAYDLRGFAALEARLKSLSGEEATKAGQTALNAGARLMKTEVADRAPVSAVAEGTIINRKGGRKETHHKIKNSVKTKKVRSDAGTVETAVYISKKAYHAAFVEFGSIHNAPNPFMLSALQADGQAAIDKVRKSLNKQLVKRGV